MEDVLTDIPPPSRFFLDDLNNFALPPASLPSPFLVFSNSKPKKSLDPSLFIVAISLPSLNFFHSISSKSLIGTVILPEISLTGNFVEPSIRDKSCNIYSLDSDNKVIILSVQYPVDAGRAYAFAKLLVGEQIMPERVLILDSVQSRNFRGKLSPDETFAFKLETSAERKGVGDGNEESPLLKGLGYFPSGSVIDGLAAALLSQCEMKKIKGTLCVSWPEIGVSVALLIKSLLLKNVLTGLELSIDCNLEDDCLRFSRNKEHLYDNELYT